MKQNTVRMCIETTNEREEMKKNLIYVDFKTYVKFTDNEIGEEFNGNAYSDIPLSYFTEISYVPFTFVDADRNTSKYTYPSV